MALATASSAVAQPSLDQEDDSTVASQDPKAPVGDLDETVEGLPPQGPLGSNPIGTPRGGGDLGDIGEDVVASISENWLLTGAIAFGVAGMGIVVYFLANRYLDPKEALVNPQRSMLYGFIKGNPGVHLKQLSSDFGMKTSTVLWHVRKLECADLVRSRKSNGYRVFYPVSGGVEARELSSAVTALSNENARRIFEYIALRPGVAHRRMAEELGINAGTVRWHLKKMRGAGLTVELTKERLGYFYATDLGIKAMRQVAGLPPDVSAPTIDLSALAEPEAAAS